MTAQFNTFNDTVRSSKCTEWLHLTWKVSYIHW